MIRLDIKPLSVNEATSVFRGMKIKTRKYREYEREVLSLLPTGVPIPLGKIELKLKFGVSRTTCDVDNLVKPFVDILQRAYEFNDKMIYKLEVKKFDVLKGQEFVEFLIL